MSEQITIHAGVIHRITKSKFSGREEAGLRLQKKLHTRNERLLGFIDYAELTLERRGSNRSISGGFGIDNTLSKILFDRPTPPMGDEEYLSLTQEIVAGLFEFVVKKSATTGEHIPVVFYEKNNTHYLLISLISLSAYMSIDENSEFGDTSAIDSDALKVGVLINLSEMENHKKSKEVNFEPNYIRWIQRRSTKLPDYIQEFIPVGKKIDDKKSTNSFFSALNNFLKTTFEQEETRSDIRSEIISVMRTRLDSGEAIHIEEDIDPILTSAMKRFGLESLPDFVSYRTSQKTQLNSSFIPEKSTLDNFERFKIEIAGGDISIRGKIKDLGRKVKILSEGDENYIKIRIQKEEYNQLRMKHAQLEE